MKHSVFINIFLVAYFCYACGNKHAPEKLPEPEAISLLGKALYPRILPPEVDKDYKRKLRDTRKVAKAHPKEEIALIWYGRRLAYLGHYRKAIEVYTAGLDIHPESFKLLRHRGHRYITIRNFDRAIADLSRAAVLAIGTTPETEPDGIPNKLNKPLTTTQWNIYYHLGLAYFLNGELEKALDAWNTCYELSDNPDVLVAATDWLYMTYRRLGRNAEAAEFLSKITPDMKMIENDAYFKRIMMYKGLASPDALLHTGPDDTDPALSLATQGYGVGNWHLYNGDTLKAKTVFENIIEGDYWAAFGYIAAEADLARMTE